MVHAASPRAVRSSCASQTRHFKHLKDSPRLSKASERSYYFSDYVQYLLMGIVSNIMHGSFYIYQSILFIPVKLKRVFYYDSTLRQTCRPIELQVIAFRAFLLFVLFLSVVPLAFSFVSLSITRAHFGHAPTFITRPPLAL